MCPPSIVGDIPACYADLFSLVTYCQLRMIPYFNLYLMTLMRRHFSTLPCSALDSACSLPLRLKLLIMYSGGLRLLDNSSCQALISKSCASRQDEKVRG